MRMTRWLITYFRFNSVRSKRHHENYENMLKMTIFFTKIFTFFFWSYSFNPKGWILWTKEISRNWNSPTLISWVAKTIGVTLKRHPIMKIWIKYIGALASTCHNGREETELNWTVFFMVLKNFFLSEWKSALAQREWECRTHRFISGRWKRSGFKNKQSFSSHHIYIYWVLFFIFKNCTPLYRSYVYFCEKCLFFLRLILYVWYIYMVDWLTRSSVSTAECTKIEYLLYSRDLDHLDVLFWKNWNYLQILRFRPKIKKGTIFWFENDSLTI